jgi:hypothetical protein
MSDKTKLPKVKKRIAKDKIVFGLVCFFSFLSMIPLFLIIWNVVSKGYKNFSWRLFTEVAPSSMDALIAKMSGEPTNTVRNILSREGVLMKKHLLGGVAKGAFSEEEAEKRFQEWKENKQKTLESLKNKDEEKQRAEEKARFEAEKKINEEKAKALAKKRAEMEAANAPDVEESATKEPAVKEKKKEEEVPATEGKKEETAKEEKKEEKEEPEVKAPTAEKKEEEVPATEGKKEE